MRRRSAALALLPALLVGAAAAPGRAEQRPAVIVTPGSAQTFQAALQRFADRSTPPSAQRSQAFREQLSRALEFSSVFEVVPFAAFLGPEDTQSLDGGPPLVCSDWTQIGADAFVEGELEAGPTELRAEFRVWDTTRCRSLLRKRYQQPRSADPAVLARRIADDVVEAFIGVRGVAGTEIAFISSRGGSPEVYVMGADGSSPRAATANRSLNNFPSWSPTGDAIVYTSYRRDNRPLLYLSSRGLRRPGRLLNGNGGRAEYRGVFDSSGKRLAVVLSDEGESEIYVVRADGGGLRRLTRNRAIDVSPSWSPDGSQLAFVSDRSGSPQIYVMSADGGSPRRLTFDGNYNTSPAWSPDGNWIAYETRVEGQFDIWLIDPAGSVNVPLITHPRSDESPTWAPNARKLAFSSTRRGRSDIYVIDVNGENLRRLTEGAGDNTRPAWGPFLR